ncbi:hypothetical protein [Methanolobus sp.]|uniref:hypothetical protein n=1 Tax=Methanolobus sp. TaxID=1874737 RepID=UPI0025FE2379|nr:hypothetical protein [Methanolobus sp.]
MQILITNIIDTALVIGVIAVFLLVDIIAKSNLKIGLKDIGADLAIGALAIQLALVITLLTNREMEHFYINVVLAVCFAVIWAVCLWLPGKKDVLGNMFSYTLGTFALSLSILHVLGASGITEIILVIAASLILSVAGFLFADYLNNERISQRFLSITKELNAYEMSEHYRKMDSGKSVFDPLQLVVDIIRGALRNDDDLTAVKGVHALGKFGSEVLMKGGSSSLIISHLSAHLYRLGALAESEEKTDTLNEIIKMMAGIGSDCAEKNMDSSTLLVMEHMRNLFTLHKSGKYILPGGRIAQIRKANTVKDFYNVLADNYVSTPTHKFALAAGRIGQTAATQKMIEPVEKSVNFLKIIALDAASNKDIHTLEHIRKAMVNIAVTVRENRLESIEKQIIMALRDICIKTVQESPDRKKKDTLHKVVATFREMGDIFGERSYLEITGSLKDIGVTAARKHSDEKVVDVICHIEYFCVCAAEKNMDEEASLSVNALAQVCEASIKEQMVESTALSSKTLAGLSQKEELTVFVNEAVFEIGKYREIDREMFALFEKTYNNSGGR